MDNDSILQIFIMLICVVFSAYFSATETAFTSLNRVAIKTMAKNNNKKAEKVLKLTENYDKLLTTILVGNNIVNIALSAIATVFFINNVSKNLGATLSTIVVTVIVLIFGEITPKSIAKENAERFALSVCSSIKFFCVVFTPLCLFFGIFKKAATKIFKSKSIKSATENEILTLVDEAQSQGEFGENESDLIRSAIEFNEIVVEDIFTPRVDVVAVEYGASNSEIAKIFSESGFSRIPVFKENIDNIIGTINEKDFYKTVYNHSTPIDEIINEPFFIPASMKITELMQTLQKNKRHFAVITDEYGGTKGIVTLEDILEELVGEIWDEHDKVIKEIESLGNNTYSVTGSLDFEEFCEFFKIKTETEMNSVGGFVMERLSKVPEKGDKFTFENLSITVTQTHEKRAEKIVVKVEK